MRAHDLDIALDELSLDTTVGGLPVTTLVGGGLAIVGLSALVWTILSKERQQATGERAAPDSTDVVAAFTVALPATPSTTPSTAPSTAPSTPPEPATASTSVEPPPDVSPPPPPAPKPVPTPHATPSPGGSCLTALENVGEPVWSPLGADKEIAVLIPDLATGGFAHASKNSSLAVAAKYGASLPTREDMLTLADQAKSAGLELDPVILPGASHELMQEGAVSGGPGIMSARWAKISDDLIRAQLTARGWDGRQAVANAGKVWLDAPAGQVHLMGWRQKNGTWIQSGTDTGPGHHSPDYYDYSSLLTIVRPAQNVA